MFTITRKSLLTEYKALIHQPTPKICTLTFQNRQPLRDPLNPRKELCVWFLNWLQTAFYLSARNLFKARSVDTTTSLWSPEIVTFLSKAVVLTWADQAIWGTATKHRLNQIKFVSFTPNDSTEKIVGVTRARRHRTTFLNFLMSVR